MGISFKLKTYMNERFKKRLRELEIGSLLEIKLERMWLQRKRLECNGNFLRSRDWIVAAGFEDDILTWDSGIPRETK